MTDFHLTDHGSVCLLLPRTEQAHNWVIGNLPGDTLGMGKSWVIEPRYVDDILAGIAEDGLEVGI